MPNSTREEQVFVLNGEHGQGGAMATQGEDTIIISVDETRVRLGKERRAAYLKLIADAPRETHVAFWVDETLLGMADRAVVAAHIEDGETVTFQLRDWLTGLIGELRVIRPTYPVPLHTKSNSGGLSENWLQPNAIHRSTSTSTSATLPIVSVKGSTITSISTDQTV